MSGECRVPVKVVKQLRTIIPSLLLAGKGKYRRKATAPYFHFMVFFSSPKPSHRLKFRFAPESPSVHGDRNTPN